MLRNYFDARAPAARASSALPLGCGPGPLTARSSAGSRGPSCGPSPRRTRRRCAQLVRLLLAAGAPRHRLAYPGTTDEYASWLSKAQLAPTPSDARHMAVHGGSRLRRAADPRRQRVQVLPALASRLANSTFVHLEVACAAAVHGRPARCSHSASALGARTALAAAHAARGAAAHHGQGVRGVESGHAGTRDAPRRCALSSLVFRSLLVPSRCCCLLAAAVAVLSGTVLARVPASRVEVLGSAPQC